MRLKSVLVFLFIGIFLFSVMPEFVRADPVDDLVGAISSLLEGAYEVIREPLEIIVGEASGGEWFLAKILFLIIIFSLVWVTISKIGFIEEHAWAHWLIALSVSILSIRWIKESEVLEGILLPYSTFGIAVTAGLPFILFFFLIKDYRPMVVQKIAWFFFGVVFVGLYIYRFSDVASAGYAYLVIAIIALWMVFGGAEWTQKIGKKMKAEDRKELNRIKIRNELVKEAKELEQARGHLSDGEYSHWMRDLNTRAKRWGIDPKTL